MFEGFSHLRYPEVKSKKYNNPYKVDNDKATEIWELPNEELVKRLNREYQNIETNQKRKKNDPEIVRLTEEEKELKEAVQNHPRMVELKERHEQEQKALEDTDPEINQLLVDLATVKEELSNERKEYTADTKEFKGLFRLCMDEVKFRIESGAMEN